MIKRFNPDFSLSISHELAYMRETPEGGYVAHGDYATLFSELELVKADRDALADRVNALAVENAERGEIIERLIGIFTASGYHAIQNSYDPCMALLYDAFQAIKHPATSAELAAIEARGVEKFAEATIAIGEQEEEESITYAGKQAMLFAKQLREGK